MAPNALGTERRIEWAIMLRINTLGGLWIERDGRRIEGNAPRRSALLAILAAAGERGVSRDRLLLFLWPDATEERGRHTLSQTVYSINRQLGGEVVATNAAQLRLDPAVASDVAELEAAHLAGDLTTVVDRYRGPFLDGFILSDAAEFEEWASGERRRLEQIAREAMERLAAAAPTAHEAAALWRRLTALDPLATRYAVALARAAARAGDPGAAIKQLRAHQQFLRAETGAHPPAEVSNLLAELAAAPIAAPRSSPALSDEVAVAPGSNPDPQAPFETAAAAGTVADPLDPPAGDGSGGATLERASRSPAPGSLRRWAAIAVAVALTAVAVVALTRRAAKPLTGGAMVILTDTENLTADSTLGPALTVAAGVALQQSAGFSLYSRARLAESLRRLGRPFSDTVLSESLAKEIALREAGQAVVALSVAPLGDRLLLAGRVIEPSTGVVVAARREAVDSTGDLLDGLDRLMGWVRRQLGDADWNAVPPLPLVTTSSIAALRSFAEARRAFARGDDDANRAALERAIAADTGFAMAQARLGSFFIRHNAIRPGLHWLRQARDRSARLTEPEQLDVALSLARAEDRTDDAIALSAAFATRFPSALRWYSHGEALRRANRDAEALDAFARAVALDSNSAEYHQSIALTKQHMGDLRGAVDAFDRAWRADSSLLLRDFYNQQWGSVFVELGDFARAESVFRKMITADSGQRVRGYRSLAYVSLRRGRYREGIDRLDSAIVLFRVPSLSLYRDLTLRADAVLSRGDLAAANATLDRAMAVFRAKELEAPFLTFIGHQLIRAGRLGDARLVLDSLRKSAALRPDATRDQAGLAVLSADLALARGRPREALDFLAGKPLGPLAHAGTLIAIDALSQIDARDSALTLAREAVEHIPFGIEGMQDVFRTFGRLARVAVAVGDSATARQAYSALLAHWKDGDADLPLVVEARRELDRLHRGVAR